MNKTLFIEKLHFCCGL